MKVIWIKTSESTKLFHIFLGNMHKFEHVGYHSIASFTSSSSSSSNTLTASKVGELISNSGNILQSLVKDNKNNDWVAVCVCVPTLRCSHCYYKKPSMLQNPEARNQLQKLIQQTSLLQQCQSLLQ